MTSVACDSPLPVAGKNNFLISFTELDPAAPVPVPKEIPITTDSLINVVSLIAVDPSTDVPPIASASGCSYATENSNDVAFASPFASIISISNISQFACFCSCLTTFSHLMLPLSLSRAVALVVGKVEPLTLDESPTPVL